MKSKPIKVDLNILAKQLALMDNPSGRNEDVIAAKTILAKLGCYLRNAVNTPEAFAIFTAIVERAGVEPKTRK